MKTDMELRKQFREESDGALTHVNGEYSHEYGFWLEQKLIQFQPAEGEMEEKTYSGKQVLKFMQDFSRLHGYQFSDEQLGELESILTPSSSGEKEGAGMVLDHTEAEFNERYKGRSPFAEHIKNEKALNSPAAIEPGEDEVEKAFKEIMQYQMDYVQLARTTDIYKIAERGLQEYASLRSRKGDIKWPTENELKKDAKVYSHNRFQYSNSNIRVSVEAAYITASERMIQWIQDRLK